LKFLKKDLKTYKNQHNLSMIELLKQNHTNFEIFKNFLDPSPLKRRESGSK
jgi:hypothetical protein